MDDFLYQFSCYWEKTWCSSSCRAGHPFCFHRSRRSRDKLQSRIEVRDEFDEATILTDYSGTLGKLGEMGSARKPFEYRHFIFHCSLDLILICLSSPRLFPSLPQYNILIHVGVYIIIGSRIASNRPLELRIDFWVSNSGSISTFNDIILITCSSSTSGC